MTHRTKKFWKSKKKDPKCIGESTILAFVRRFHQRAPISLGVGDEICAMRVLAARRRVEFDKCNHYAWFKTDYGVDNPVMFIDSDVWCAFYKHVTPFVGTGGELKKALSQFLAARRDTINKN